MAFTILSPDGRVIAVHTEVGDNLITRVVVEEVLPPPSSLDQEDVDG